MAHSISFSRIFFSLSHYNGWFLFVAPGLFFKWLEKEDADEVAVVGANFCDG